MKESAGRLFCTLVNKSSNILAIRKIFGWLHTFEAKVKLVWYVVASSPGHSPLKSGLVLTVCACV